MKHVAWFKLILRCLGIMMVVYGLPTTLSAIAGAAQLFGNDNRWMSWGSTLPKAVLYYTVYNLASVFYLVIGSYLLFDARWLVRVCILDAVNRCPACKYDLTGAAPGVCPECGVKLPSGVYFPDRTLVTTIRSLNELTEPAQSLEQGESAGAEPRPSAASHPPSDPGR